MGVCLSLNKSRKRYHNKIMPYDYIWHANDIKYENEIPLYSNNNNNQPIHGYSKKWYALCKEIHTWSDSEILYGALLKHNIEYIIELQPNMFEKYLYNQVIWLYKLKTDFFKIEMIMAKYLIEYVSTERSEITHRIPIRDVWNELLIEELKNPNFKLIRYDEASQFIKKHQLRHTSSSTVKS